MQNGFGNVLRQICKTQTRDLIENWADGGCRSVYLGNGEVLCRVLRQLLMVVSAEDISVCPHLIMRGIWEPWVTMAIARHVKPGMRVIDVGAHVGYYTLLLSELVSSGGHVVALEPNGELRALIKKTLSVNGHTDKVTLLDSGASDVYEQRVLIVPPWISGGAKLVPVGKDPDLVTSAHVQCLPLDDIIGSEVDVDFIKIDVEGMERQVLGGLKRTIARQKSLTIAVEVTPWEWLPDSPVGTFEALKLQGFSIGVIGPSGAIEALDYDRLPTEKGQWEMVWITR